MRAPSLLVFLTFASCAHAIDSVSAGQLPLMVADNLEYDSTSVSFRFLLSGHESIPSVLDGRIVENVHLRIAAVRACDGKSIPYLVEDYFPAPPDRSDLVTLQPHYHYGTDLKFTVFKRPGPECILADFLFWPGVGPATLTAPLSLRFETKPK